MKFETVWQYYARISNIKCFQNESIGLPITRWHRIWFKYLENCKEKEYWKEDVFNFSLKISLETFFTPTNISLVKLVRDMDRNDVKCHYCCLILTKIEMAE
jgi:hypothetical protein